MAHSEKTDDTSEDPISAASRFSLVRSEHRILGDLGVMAVQSFSRIRVRVESHTAKGRKAFFEDTMV
jgi:hypothetical protein